MATADEPDAQWPVFLDLKCEICEVNDVDFKCLNCNELLCNSCKKMHLKSKMAKNHKLVNLKNAEVYQRKETETKCPTHTTEDLLMYCGSCQVPICRDCIASGSHLNHQMVKIENVIDNKQCELANLIRESKEKSTKYEDVVKTIDKNSQEFSLSVSQIISRVKARNKQLKDKLDKIESDYIKHLQDADTENQKIMAEFKSRLQEEMTDVNQLIQQCEENQRNRNIGLVQLVTDVTRRLEKYEPCDPPDVACPPNLITRHEIDKELKDLFGHLEMKTTPTANPPLHQKPNIPSTSPVIDVEIVGSFSSCKTRVVTTRNDQAWLWKGRYSGILLVTSDGKVIKDIQTGFGVYSAAVTIPGDLLVTKHMDNKVKKLTGHDTFTDIYTADDDFITGEITVTCVGNILFELRKNNGCKVVEITTSGQYIRTIQHDAVDNTSLFDNLKYICANINGDIILQNNFAKVVAVTKSNTKRFIYDGNERKLQESFSYWCVATDKYGNIMIADYNNSVVHMLNQDGKFLKYLITRDHGCNRPRGIAIDTSGRLWVCNRDNSKVLVVKYLK